MGRRRACAPRRDRDTEADHHHELPLFDVLVHFNRQPTAKANLPHIPVEQRNLALVVVRARGGQLAVILSQRHAFRDDDGDTAVTGELPGQHRRLGAELVHRDHVGQAHHAQHVGLGVRHHHQPVHHRPELAQPPDAGAEQRICQRGVDIGTLGRVVHDVEMPDTILTRRQVVAVIGWVRVVQVDIAGRRVRGVGVEYEGVHLLARAPRQLPAQAGQHRHDAIFIQVIGPVHFNELFRTRQRTLGRGWVLGGTGCILSALAPRHRAPIQGDVPGVRGHRRGADGVDDFGGKEGVTPEFRRHPRRHEFIPRAAACAGQRPLERVVQFFAGQPYLARLEPVHPQQEVADEQQVVHLLPRELPRPDQPPRDPADPRRADDFAAKHGPRRRGVQHVLLLSAHQLGDLSR